MDRLNIGRKDTTGKYMRQEGISIKTKTTAQNCAVAHVPINQ